MSPCHPHNWGSQNPCPLCEKIALANAVPYERHVTDSLDALLCELKDFKKNVSSKVGNLTEELKEAEEIIDGFCFAGDKEIFDMIARGLAWLERRDK